MVSLLARYRRYRVRPAAEPSESFGYVKLEYTEQQIRLLRPSRGAVDTALPAFTLETWAMKSAPPHAAISYTWGSSVTTCTIVINHKSFVTRESTRNALLQAIAFVRTSDNEEVARLNCFWIDAICINQSDLEEKSNQVGIMGDIYEKAEAIVACLGPHQRDSHLLFNNKASGLLSGASFTAMKAFCNRDYWARLWIVQEILLSVNRSFVLCGSAGMSLRQFSLLFESMFGDLVHTKFHTVSAEVSRFLASSNSGRQSLPLRTALGRYSQQGCGDSRDRIFGLLSLLQWPKGCRPLEPDYSLTKVDLSIALLRLTVVQDDGSEPFTPETLEYIRDVMNLMNVRGESDVNMSTALRSRIAIDACQGSIQQEPCVRVGTNGRIIWHDRRGAMQFSLHTLLLSDHVDGFALDPPLTEAAMDVFGYYGEPEHDGKYWSTLAKAQQLGLITLNRYEVGVVCPEARTGDFLLPIVMSEDRFSRSYVWLVLRYNSDAEVFEVLGEAFVDGGVHPSRGHSRVQLHIDPEDLLVLTIRSNTIKNIPEGDSLRRASTYAKRRFTRSRWSSFAVSQADEDGKM